MDHQSLDLLWVFVLAIDLTLYTITFFIWGGGVIAFTTFPVLNGQPEETFYWLARYSCLVCERQIKNVISTKSRGMQTCHSDLTKNLNESKKKSEYAEKNLNLTIKIGLLYSNLYQIQSQKNLNLESDYLNFTKIQEKNLNDSDKI